MALPEYLSLDIAMHAPIARRCRASVWVSSSHIPAWGYVTSEHSFEESQRYIVVADDGWSAYATQPRFTLRKGHVGWDY